MPAASIIYLAFVKKERIAGDVCCYFFDRKEADFQFVPGQYVQIILPHKNPDDRGTSRFFTIASSPTEKEYLMITTRAGESSFKRALSRLKPGTTVQFFGPIGKFTLE